MEKEVASGKITQSYRTGLSLTRYIRGFQQKSLSGRAGLPDASEYALLCTVAVGPSVAAQVGQLVVGSPARVSLVEARAWGTTLRRIAKMGRLPGGS